MDVIDVLMGILHCIVYLIAGLGLLAMPVILFAPERWIIRAAGLWPRVRCWDCHLNARASIEDSVVVAECHEQTHRYHRTVVSVGRKQVRGDA